MKSIVAKNASRWKKFFANSPCDWEFVCFEDLFRETRERSSDRATFPLHSFTIEDGVTPKTERYEREFLLKDQENNLFAVVHPGDLVFNPMNLRYGAISFSNVPIPVSVSAYYVTLRPDETKCVPSFMGAFLRSTAMMEIYDHIAIGSLVEKRRVHLSALNGVCFPLPPIDEQRILGVLFSDWNSAVSELTDLIDAKLSLKLGLFQKLLTGVVRFPGFVDEWHSVRLSEVTEECNERNRSRLGLESVMAVTKADGIVPMRERTIGASIDRYLIVQKDCFAYNPMRINIGSIARWKGDRDILVSPDYVVFRCKERSKDSPGLDPDFLDQFRQSRLWENFVMATGNGSVRIRIYYSELSQLKMKLPSLAEQKKIANLLNAIDREIELLRKQLELLKLQKKGFMQKLLTGQVRVKLPKGAM